MATDDQKNWLTPKEAGSHPKLTLSAQTMIRLVEAGELEATIKHGSRKRRRFKINPASLEAYIKKITTPMAFPCGGTS